VVLYRLIVELILGVEIPAKTTIGPGLQIFHGQRVVVNGDAIIGKNAFLRNGVTIGNKTLGCGLPKVGDNVSFGANTVLIGELTLGNNVIVGALPHMNKSFGSNLIIAGNPAYIIEKLNPV
jgi:putative colanic acid biosynthesis acetyltransferase WcaB